MKKKIIAYVVSAVMVLTMVPATAFAATDTDDSGMSKTVVPTLDAEKEGAKAKLDDVNLLAYDSATAGEISKYITDGKAAIEAAATVAEVDKAYTDANAKIIAEKTAVSIIDEYWPAKPAPATGNYSSADYDTKGNDLIDGYRSDAKEAVADVTANTEVDQIISDFKAKVDAVKTAKQTVDADVATAIEEAKAELDKYLDEVAYPGATYKNPAQGDINVAITAGKLRIEAATAVDSTAVDPNSVEYRLNAAKAEIKSLVDNNPTVDMENYEKALEKALEKVTTVGTTTTYNYADPTQYSGAYKTAIQTILGHIDTDNVGDYFFGLGRGDGDPRYFTQIIDYNKFMRDGKPIVKAGNEYEIPTIENINDIVAEIKAEIAMYPTTGKWNDKFTAWKSNVTSATTNTVNAYDNLSYLEDWHDVLYQNTSERENLATTKDVLEGKKTAYDDWNQNQLEYTYDRLPEVTATNYVDVRDDIAQIEENNEKFFDSNKALDLTSGSDFDLTNIKEAIDAEEAKMVTFIEGVYEIIPDDLTDHEWTAVDSAAMAEAKKAYDELTSTMKSDPERNEITEAAGYEDITLDEAISIYEAAVPVWNEFEAAVDAVEALIGRIPNTVIITDKDTVDAANDAFNALTKNQKVAVSNVETLTAAKQSIVDALVAKAGNDAKTAGITTDDYREWKDLTADLVAQYDAITDLTEDYDLEGYSVDTSGNFDNLDNAIYNYNDDVRDTDADYSAASAIATAIRNIKNAPENATADDLAAVEKARADYEALLTQEAKDAFKASGYLKHLEAYEATLGPIEDAKDLANATVTIPGPFIDGGLPYVARGTTPEVEVTDANGDVIPESAYTVDCNEAHPAGKTSLIIRANDGSGYTGENEAAYVVVNNKKSIKSLNGAKKSFTVKYSDYSKHGCTGTEIAWKTSKNGEWKFSKITSNKASKKITVKKAGKKYVRVRAIVKVDGIRYYSDWSKTKTVTVK